MKTKEELNTIKAEVEAMNKKLAELSEDELKQVTGGNPIGSNGQLIGIGYTGYNLQNIAPLQ